MSRFVTATGFVGDGSGLTGLQNDSLWSGVSAGLGTGIYPNDLARIGIGTSNHTRMLQKRKTAPTAEEEVKKLKLMINKRQNNR